MSGVNVRHVPLVLCFDPGQNVSLVEGMAVCQGRQLRPGQSPIPNLDTDGFNDGITVIK